MIFLLLAACMSVHKTSLTGVVDRIAGDQCTIELDCGTVVTIHSPVCVESLEGDKVEFYMSNSSTGGVRR